GAIEIAEEGLAQEGALAPRERVRDEAPYFFGERARDHHLHADRAPVGAIAEVALRLARAARREEIGEVEILLMIGGDAGVDLLGEAHLDALALRRHRLEAALDETRLEAGHGNEQRRPLMGDADRGHADHARRDLQTERGPRIDG